METIIALWSNPGTLVVAGAVTCVMAYAASAISYGLNGGQLGRGPWWVFECFWEEVIENLPGGEARKVAKLREMAAHGEGALLGRTRTWHHEELRMHGGWEECAREMFPTPTEFWLGTITTVLFAASAGTVVAYVLANTLL